MRLATGTHCSSPSSSTACRALTSTRPPRTLTEASLPAASTYSSSLSSVRSTASDPNADSAAPKSSPKVRHSHRGTIPAVKLAPSSVAQASHRLPRRRNGASTHARRAACTTAPPDDTCALAPESEARPMVSHPVERQDSRNMTRSRRHHDGDGRHLSDDDAASVLTLFKDADSVELKLTVPAQRSPLGRGGARYGCAGFADPPGVLLRHAGSRAERPRRGGARPPCTGPGRRHRRQAAAGHTLRAAGPCPQTPGVRCRGGRDAGRLRLLGITEGQSGRRGAGGGVGTPPAAQDVHEGAARVLRAARSRRA